MRIEAGPRRRGWRGLKRGVPLLVRLPGARHGGSRIAATVGTLDIAATVLDVLGIDDDGAIGGSPLTPLWSGGPDRMPLAFSYHDGLRTSMKSVVYGDWHYIENAGAPPELYFLPDDPDELNNLAATAPPALIAELKVRLRVAFADAGTGAGRLSATH